jgi:hypothetical protein
VPRELSELRSLYWDQRLDNWALWKTGGGTGFGIAFDDEGGYGSEMTKPPPPIIGAAFDTDRLVARLPNELRGAVNARYVWTGSLEMRAADMGVHRNTLANRVMEAKVQLEEMLRVPALIA